MVSKIPDVPPPSPSSGRLRVPAVVSDADTVVESVTARQDPVQTDAGNKMVLPTRYDKWKRGVDLIVGVPLGILLLPLILVTALLVKFTSHGPGFYTQTRVGRFGHCFRIYKIRSMRHNCENFSGAKWASKNDSRTTWLGRILRKTHLDELPQILNVIKGDMSLVGPRPERPEFTLMLEATVPHYKNRMVVRPGVTGLAQVYLPPDTDVNSVKRKLIYDLRYVASMNLLLDLRLLLATFIQAIGVPCGVTRFVLWLPTMKQIESPTEESPQIVPAVAGNS